MKKIRLLLCAVLLCVVAILTLTACGAGLEKPDEIRLDMDTLTISWDKIPGAIGYSVVIGEKEKVTRTNSYSLTSLEPGEYEIKIKALGDGETSEDSDVITYQFTREPETGLIYKLINNNKEYQLTAVGSASGDVVMEDTYRGKPVTSIAPSALANNGKITSFTINNNVTSIPKRAFYNCNALVSVTIPDTVTSIAENAFQSCRSLTSVVIPEAVTVINDFTFSYCRALESVTFSSATTHIGNYAFSDCSALKAIAIPDTVTYVGDYAFSDCHAVETLTIGNSVKTIGEYAFYALALVEEVTFPATLTSVGDSAFEECDAISAVSLPDAVTFIGKNAFAFCDALAQITIGENVESIGRNAFLDTKFFNDATDPIVCVGKWIIACTDPAFGEGKDISAIIPAETVGVADYAFFGADKFTSVNLPNAKYIGECAFYDCDSLMTVRLGKNCLSIGRSAFSGCKQLLDVFVSNTSIRTIGDYAFSGCSKLKKIDLPDTVEMIGARAFYSTSLSAAVDGVIYADNWAVGCISGSYNITLKEGTVGIAKYAFMQNAAINYVTFPKSLKVIGKGAFLLCSQIYITEMPSSLERIEDYAFYGCDHGMFGADYHLVLPESLEYIGRSAFYGASVMGLEIPSNCKYIGDYAFWGCSLLGNEVEFYLPPEEESEEVKTKLVRFYLTINEGVEYIGSRAFFGAGIIDLELPDSLTELGIRAFYGCAELKTVKLGDGLTVIPDFTFYGCEKLEKVKLASNTTALGKHAFRNCKALTKVDLGRSLESLDTAAFMGCESLTDLVLPSTVTTIGDYALRGMKADVSVLLHDGILTVGQHAVYGNSGLTVYMEADKDATEFWGSWNSFWRPVIYGCTLSDDKSYVVSFVKDADTIANSDALGGITAPERSGWEFLGWATEAEGEVVYSAAEVINAPDGTTLYAQWQIEQIAQ